MVISDISESINDVIFLKWKMTLIIFSISFYSFGQVENDPTLSISAITSEQGGIECVNIRTDKLLHAIEVDSINGILFFDIEEKRYTGKPKGEGVLYAYSISERKFLWDIPINYSKKNTDSRILYAVAANQLIVATSEGARGIDHFTGKTKWEITGSDFFMNPSGDILIGKLNRDETAAWNPKDGKVKWNESFDYKFGTIFFSNDSTLVSWDEDFKRINLSTGQFWIKDIKNRTPVSTYVAATGDVIAAVAFGIIFGAITGAFTGVAIIPIFQPDKVASGNRSTHLVLEDNTYYLVDGHLLKKFDYNGQVLWESEFVKEYSSNRVITVTEAGILFVSYGSAYNQDGIKIPRNKASCQIFDRENGRSHGDEVFELEGQDYLKDFVVHADSVYLLGRRSLFTLNTEYVDIYQSREFGNGYSNVGLSEFIDPSMYVNFDSTYSRIEDLKARHLFIRNTATKVIEFSADLEIRKVFDNADFFDLMDGFGDVYLLQNSYETVLTNTEGKSLFNEFFSPNAQLSNGYLIERTEVGGRVTDLRDISQ
jgi:outer membrane protein assembly factor BamB